MRKLSRARLSDATEDFLYLLLRRCGWNAVEAESAKNKSRGDMFEGAGEFPTVVVRELSLQQQNSSRRRKILSTYCCPRRTLLVHLCLLWKVGKALYMW